MNKTLDRQWVADELNAYFRMHRITSALFGTDRPRADIHAESITEGNELALELIGAGPGDRIRAVFFGPAGATVEHPDGKTTLIPFDDEVID